MAQVNIMEAQADLFKLISRLESGQEDVIEITRNGIPVVEMKLAQEKAKSKRIGAAKGKFIVPDEFDNWDYEINEMIGK